MAYTNLGSASWGSLPTIGLTFDYDYRRSGTAMQYKIKVTVAPVTGASYFGFPIYAKILIDGTELATATIKEADVRGGATQWTSAIVWETNWLTVNNKISGTAAITINIYSGLGADSSRNCVYNYSGYVVPAVSTLTADNGTLGTVQTLKITRNDDSYKHTIKYSCGSASGTIITKTADTNVKWTPPLSLASQNANGTVLSVTLTLETYSVDTLIGSYPLTITLAIPSSVVPTLSMAVSDALGYFDIYGSYIQRRSRLQIDLTANGAYGSEIKSYKIIAGSFVYTEDSALTPVLPSVGTITVSAEIVDSRGRKATDSKQITVTAYTPPTISNVTVGRCDSNGNVSNTGTYGYVQFSGAITSLSNQNGSAYTINYREYGTETWNALSAGSGYSLTNKKITFEADTSKSWEVYVTAWDSFGTVSSGIYTIARGYMPFQVSDRGASVGEEAQDGYFSVASGIKTQLKGGVEVTGDIEEDGEKLKDKYQAKGKFAGSSSEGGAATSAEKLHTKRNITIGNTKKEFDGSGDVSWTLAEIGVTAFKWKRADVTFTNGVGSVACDGVKTDSMILAMRNTPASGDGTYTGIMTAGCSTAGTVNLGLDDNSSPTLPVTIMWST